MPDPWWQREREMSRAGKKKKKNCSCTHTDAAMCMMSFTLIAFHKTSHEQYNILFFCYCVWPHSGHWSSLHFFTVSKSLFCSIYFSFCISLGVLPSLPLCLSPRGHWGQAWCRGLEHEYHVGLFRVFAGRAAARHFATEQVCRPWYSECIYIFKMLKSFLCSRVQVCSCSQCCAGF